jgi:HK97 family phage prohead protease
VDERGAVRIGGQVTNPGGTERLHEYWVHGEGAAKIRWGSPGDWQRCVDHLGKYIRDPKGYCNLAHKAATGMYPAQHAAMEHKAGRSQVSEPAYDGDGLDASWDGDHSDLPDLTGLDVSHFEAAAGDTADPAASRAAKLGSGARFKKLKASLAAKGARDPGALAAHIGRKKYGKAKFMSLAAKARGGTKRSDAPPARGEYMRLYQLEDIHILRSADGGDGRTVEAYAAVFGQEAEIRDHEGHYLEVIEPTAFSRAIDHAQRARGGFPGSVKVLYNHGMTLNGSPSERFSMPIGVPVDIRAEARGLLTRTRYSETPLADEVLENIRSGAITSQSFTGRIMRSDPQLRAGDRHRPRSGQLTTVRRTELGLREYGPVLWPAYTGAEILGVRMSTPGGALDPDEEELDDATGTPPDDGPAAGDPPPQEEEHSARYHQHALYALRSRELREKYGLVW